MQAGNRRLRRSIPKATSRTSRPTSPGGAKRTPTPKPSSTGRCASIVSSRKTTIPSSTRADADPCWDLAEDPNSFKLIESFLAAGKTIALVCHPPAFCAT
jgi:hypothetical protein